MKIKFASTLAAAALLSGAGLAQAQDRGQQDRSMDLDRPVWSERLDSDRYYDWSRNLDRGWRRDGDQDRRTRADRRGEELLRNVLREAGFSNIRILDAAYLVQARTPDGRNVMMFIDPPPRDVGRPMARQSEGRDPRGLADRMRDRMDGQMSDRDRSRMQQQMQDHMEGMQGRMEGRMADRMQNRMARQDSGTDPLDRDPPTAMQWTQPFDLSPTEEARQLLRAQGMENIRDLEQTGEDRVSATADWYGEEVDVEVNVGTGEIIEPQRMSESQVRNRLEERGWQDVRNVERNGNEFEVTADREGQRFRLVVDAENGLLLRWREEG